jgi:DNA-binding LacI/PurR family transcriptional regulator
MDIAVTGFDAVPSVADPRIRLTTIAPHWDRIAETAATMLIERNVPEVGRIDLPTELVLGDST